MLVGHPRVEASAVTRELEVYRFAAKAEARSSLGGCAKCPESHCHTRASTGAWREEEASGLHATAVAEDERAMRAVSVA